MKGYDVEYVRCATLEEESAPTSVDDDFQAVRAGRRLGLFRGL